MKTLHVIALLVLLTAFVESLPSDEAAVTPVGKAQPAQPDSAIVAKLRELITLREQQAEVSEVLAQAGRASGAPSAAVALAEARVELARELGQPEVILAQLQRILELRRDWVSYLKTAVADRARELDLIEAQAALIQAEVQLLREQKRLKEK